MPYEQIRKSLVAAVEVAKLEFDPTLVIEYDNRIIDMQQQSLPYLKVQVRFMDAMRAAIGPMNRVHGQVHLIAAVKEGQGSAKAYTMLSHFGAKLQSRSISGVRTMVSSPHPQSPHIGWVYYPILLPFWFDKNV